MHVTERLKNKEDGETLFSIELLPPTKGGMEEIFPNIERLLEYRPTFVSVTAHPNQVEIEKVEGGEDRVHITRRGINTNMLCLLIKERYKNLEVVPHIICRGFKRSETEEALHDLNSFGVDNVIALLGDLKGRECLNYIENGYEHAYELVEQVNNMNNGKFLDKKTERNPTNYCIGIAGYPEGLVDPPNYHKDIEYLKKKIGSGGNFIITNMFFDNNHYYRFLDSIQKAGINVPVIPGLKPIFTKKHIESIPENFNVKIEDSLLEKLIKYDKPSDRKAAGVEHTVIQCMDLIQQGVPCIHFYTMNKGPVPEILSIVRGEEAKNKLGLNKTNYTQPTQYKEEVYSKS